MLFAFAEGIASFFIQKEMLDTDWFDWCVYSIQRNVMPIMGTVALIALGAMLSKLWNTLIFLQSDQWVRFFFLSAH